MTTSRDDFTTNCVGCRERLPRERIEWYPVVSRATGLYYPGEPFCGMECYKRYVGQEDAPYREPDADQKRAFVRMMTVPL